MNNYQLKQTFLEMLKEQPYVETITSNNESGSIQDGIVGNINEQKL